MPEDRPGTSLVTLTNQPGDPNRAVFSEYHATGAATGAFMIGADKVYLSVRVGQCRRGGSALCSFASLWVVTRLDGKWAAQLRSSFAKDDENSRSR